MNEMNNQGNGFNNQNVNFENQNLNYENNNYGENNYNQFNQEQGNNMSHQNDNEEKSNKSYCGLLVVFMVISLLLTGFIVYDKVIKKDEAPKQETNDNNKENQTSTGVKVEELMFKTFKGSSNIELRLPKLIGNTETIKKLNDTIQEDMINSYLINVEEIMGFIDEYIEDEDNNYKTREDLGDVVDGEISCFKETSVDYKVYQKNDVLAIEIINSSCPRASGDLDNTGSYYFYDIVKDSNIDYVEAAERFNAKIVNEVHDENEKDIEPCKTFKDLKKNNDYEVSISINEKNDMEVVCANHY